MTLDGDYSCGIRLHEDSLVGIEQLDLLGGSYVIEGVLGVPTEKAGSILIDASQLDVNHSLDLDVETVVKLVVLGGAGDDILRGSQRGEVSTLIGAAGDDILTGSGASLLFGDVGADRVVMTGAGDVALYASIEQSRRGSVDRIENFSKSGGKIEFSFDADSTMPNTQHDFHLGRTAERVGDIVSHYDAAHDFTVVKVFTDHDNQADLILHLTGDVPLTPADFIFG